MQPIRTPALVDKACWKGDVAVSTFFATCLAIVRATILLTMSPTTIPRTPLSGLLSAVMRPNLMDPIWASNCESASLSRTGKRWSGVMPDGPCAAPRLALRRHVKNSNIHSGSVRAVDVAKVPGASAPPSNACLVADNSTTLTKTKHGLPSSPPHRCLHVVASS